MNDSTNSVTDSIEIELVRAIRLLRIAESTARDARLALIKAGRIAGATGFYSDLMGHVKQVEEVVKNHGHCASAIEVTLSVMRGDGNIDVEIIQGR
jgi:hypothetical protein